MAHRNPEARGHRSQKTPTATVGVGKGARGKRLELNRQMIATRRQAAR